MRLAALALLSVAAIGSSMAGLQRADREQAAQPNPEPRLYIAYSKDGAGFIDRSGKWVIEPQFTSASEFVMSRTTAMVDDRYVLIDRAGNIVFEFPESYTWIGAFSEGLAPAYDGENIGYVGLNGQVRIPFEYDWIPSDEIMGEFNNGLAVVSKGEFMGAINVTGRVVIPIEYDYIWDFKDGAALAKKEDEEGAIDTWGRFFFLDSSDCYIMNNYFNGLAPATTEDFEGYGYIDKQGEWAIGPDFSDVAQFEGVYAAVVVDGLIGFIDRKGAFVIEPKFAQRERYYGELAGNFMTEDSLCWVPLDGDLIGYIDKSGEVVIEAQFDYADDFKDGLALVYTGTHIGYIDVAGEWVYKVAFDEIRGDGLLSGLLGSHRF